MSILLIFIFGLIVGSFLNAVIFRLHSGESFLFGHSHCMYCGKTLQAWDLIPVLSFLFLRGHCRYCGKKISWQYPIIELITAVIFALLAYTLHPTPYTLQFWFQLVMACFLIIIAVFDFKHYLILDKVVLPATVLVMVYNIWHGQLFLGILSGLGVAGFFLLQYLVSKGHWIGLGDVKLGFFLGNLFGWPQSLVMLMLAYFGGALAGLTLMALGRKKFSSRLAFGTFLSFSAIITMLYGSVIMNWYFKLIGL